MVVLIIIISVILYLFTDLSVKFRNDYFNFFSVSTINNKDGLYVHFIEVGCADSIFITDKNKNILIDTGNQSLRSRSLEYLKDNCINKLDVMFLTHYDRDHIGCAVDIMKEIKVDKIIVSNGFINQRKENNLVLSIIKTAKQRNVEIEEISAYNNIDIGDLTFEIFSPLIEYDDPNNNSIVSRLVYGDTSFLLTGDVAQKAEEDILSSYRDIKADVLKVAHHGSATSSTKEFIDAVGAKYAVVSVGDNYYGLPSYYVIDSIEQSGAKLYRTDISGTIVIYSDGESLKFFTDK